MKKRRLLQLQKSFLDFKTSKIKKTLERLSRN